MPRNSVTDPITDQEIAFARFVLSGTMNDSQAAEAAGLNPTTAAYTKSKPRVRDYMIEHRTAINQKLIDQEAETLRSRNLARQQILDRLWELASLNPEVTRGSIAGQVKAMSMILAIEGLIPGRRTSPAQAQTASPPVTAVEAQPTTPPARPANDATSVNEHQGHTSQGNPFIHSNRSSSVLNTMPLNCDAHINPISSLRLPTFARGR